MTLVITDRATGEERRLSHRAGDGQYSDDFYAEIRRLASLLEKPLASVQEALVCGNTFTTAGYAYTLID